MSTDIIKCDLEIKKAFLKLQTVNLLNRWKKGKAGFPLRLEIQPTEKCNQNCIYCSRKSDIQKIENIAV